MKKLLMLFSMIYLFQTSKINTIESHYMELLNHGLYLIVMIPSVVCSFEIFSKYSLFIFNKFFNKTIKKNK